MRATSSQPRPRLTLGAGCNVPAALPLVFAALLAMPPAVPQARAGCADTVLVREARTYSVSGSSPVTYVDPCTLTASPGRRFLIEALRPGTSNPLTTAQIQYGSVEYFGSGDIGVSDVLISRVVAAQGPSFLKVTLSGSTGAQIVVRITQVPEPLHSVYSSGTLASGPNSWETTTLTRYFSFMDGVPPAPHVLTLTNGLGDSTTWARTTNTRVWLNETEIIGPWEVTSGKVFLTRNVTLSDANELQVTIPPGNPNKQVSVRIFATDDTGPGLSVTAPVDSLVTSAARVAASVQVDEPETGCRLFVDGVEKPLTSGAWNDSLELPVGGGRTTFTFIALNGACLADTVQRTVFRLVGGPWLEVTQPAAEVTTTQNASVALAGSWASAASVKVTVNGDSIPSGTPTGTFSLTRSLALGANTFTIRARDALDSTTAVTRTVIREPLGAGAAEPSAPAIATTHREDFRSMTAFLYGPGGVQFETDTSHFAPERAAVVRGRVVQATETADTIGLAHVRVVVVGHEEFGYTESRASGNFDLAVNGGGELTLEFTRDGFLTARRTISVPWRDYVRLEDVALKGFDTRVVEVTLSPTQASVARGSTIDEAGSVRASTMIFKPGTQASAVDANGDTTSLGTSISVRATEFTVGPEGPRRMPAALPAASAYTHCVDLSVLGYGHVRFSPPVAYYVENFLDLPAGTVVPVGSYNPDSGWKAEEDGMVLKVLSTTGGIASLDLNDDAEADTGAALANLGIDTAELVQLAALYQPGQSFWRSRVDHFSTWDWNFPFWWPDDWRSPDGGWPFWLGLLLADCRECPGSVIEMENQTLRESIPVVGTPYALHYSSARVPGNRRPYQVRIPLWSQSLPASVTSVHWTMDVAGQHFGGKFAAWIQGNAQQAAPKFVDVEWDGRDGYGREVVGSTNAHIKVGYAYAGVYGVAGGGGRAWGSPPSGARLSSSIRGNEGISWVEFDLALGTMRNEVAGLGDWSITPNHFYDFAGRGSLHLGNGTTAPGERRGPTIRDLAAASTAIYDLVFAVDGGLYFAEASGSQTQVRRMSLDSSTVANGTVTNVISTIVSGLGGNAHFALTSAGDLYVAEPGNHRVRLHRKDGTVEDIAGSIACDAESGDGGLARDACLRSPSAIAIDRDGTLYVVDNVARTVRRISPDGYITRFAGTGGEVQTIDDAPKPALEMPLNMINGHVRVGPTGEVYLAEQGTNRVRRIARDGVISTSAALPFPVADVAFGPDGCLYAATGYALVNGPTGVYRISPSENAVQIAGGGSSGVQVWPPSPALSAQLGRLSTLAIDPEGQLVLGQFVPSGLGQSRLYLIRPALPGYSLSEHLVASRDASEQYVFDVTGRHLRTLDAVTGGTRATFTYEAFSGGVRLHAVRDMNGDLTVITRDGQGGATIESADGHVTELEFANSRLSLVTDPAGARTHVFARASDGLLDSLRDVRGVSHHFQYEADGRLYLDLAGDGFSTTLSASADEDSLPDRAVLATSALNRASTYAVDFRDGRQTEVRTATGPDNLPMTTTRGGNESVTVLATDGTSLTYVPDPDPRFGMQSPIPKQVSVDWPDETPNSNITTTRSWEASTGELTTTTAVNDRQYISNYEVVAGVRKLTLRPPVAAREMSVTVDSVGRPLTLTSPGALADIVTHYDDRGRVDLLTVGTRQWEYYYEDARGRLTRVKDPLDRETRFAYDDADRVLWQILPSATNDPDTVFFEHDANGNLTGVRPPDVWTKAPASQWHRFALTPGELTRLYDPPDVPGLAMDTTHYEFDAERGLTAIARPDGQTVGLEYDAAGRLERVVQPRGDTELQYYTSGPGAGHVEWIDSPDGVRVSLTHDGPLPASEVWTFSDDASGVVEHAYDANLWTSRQTVSDASGPASTVTYGYQADGLVSSAVVSGGPTLSLSPATDTAVLDGTSVGGLATRFGHNPYAELTSTATWFGTDTVFAAQYDRDDLGRIVRIRETLPGGTTDRGYYYDERGRLIAVRDSLAGLALASYGYDGNGNRIGFLTSTDSVTAAYDPQDRLVDRGTVHYAYTANGERTTRTDASGTLGTSYDLLGNLITVGLPGGDAVRYEIDGRNRRVGRKFNGALTARWLYAGDLNVIGELDATGALVKRFVYASRGHVPDLLVVRNGTGPDSTYGIVTDQLGSVRAVVNVATGHVVQRITYDPWGVVTDDTNPGFTPFGFAGGLYDAATGLVRFWARDYDPQAAVWTTRDPIRFAGGTENLYSYVADDPVNLIDVDGLDITFNYYNGFPGHIGAGVNDTRTRGFYPREQTLWNLKGMLPTLGALKPDAANPAHSHRIRTTKQEDKLAQAVLDARGLKPGQYVLAGRVCTNLAADVFEAATGTIVPEWAKRWPQGLDEYLESYLREHPERRPK